jgi:hypothetical protein
MPLDVRDYDLSIMCTFTAGVITVFGMLVFLLI